MFEFDVLPGWKRGTKVTFNNDAGVIPGHGDVQADLVFVMDEKKHPVFQREGSDLHLKRAITLGEALLGGTIVVKSLEGKDVSVQLTGVVQPGKKMTVPECGMPIRKQGKIQGHGDLHIEFNVCLPKSLTAEQKELVKKLGF